MSNLRSYSVRCGYREDNGMHYPMSTHSDTVIVQALDGHAARHAAITAMYEKHGNHCSHVRPLQVVEVTDAS